MRIQFLNGGLANQAFQYIFARNYELSHPGECMYLDDSYFALHTVHNGYELGKVFGIRPHMLSEVFDEEVWGYMLKERRNGKSVPQILCENGIETEMIAEVKHFEEFNPFDGTVNWVPLGKYLPEIMDYPKDVYYHGYWINKGYFAQFEDEFLQEFRFPQIMDAKNLGYLEKIRNTLSVSVHIRRGDYVTIGWSYETKVIREQIEHFADRMPKEWELFVFSDDIAWCRENQEELGFHKFDEVTFVEGNTGEKNYIDMQLMSQCRAMIMSNSAFCYLAALLNTQKQYIINPTSREV